jgi:hypothetical protein
MIYFIKEERGRSDSTTKVCIEFEKWLKLANFVNSKKRENLEN